MAEYCPDCTLPHAPATPCAEAQAANMRTLLLRIGDVSTCKCGATIYWVRHLNGKKAPYTSAGLNHFIDCPLRAEFRRQDAS